jgi:hypothetical protein
VSDIVITRRERDVHRYNRRWQRGGIYGNSIDSAAGKELDRQAWVFGVRRNGARLFGWLLPWPQRDETLRKRAHLAYQGSAGAMHSQRLVRIQRRRQVRRLRRVALLGAKCRGDALVHHCAGKG